MGGDSLTGSVNIDLMPDRDYYLWIWPRVDAYHRMAPGTITVTVDGIYGTASTITASDGTFGSQIPVSLAVSTEGAVHDLRVSCAGRTETLLSRSAATSFVWTPDLTTYAALLPNAGSAQAVFTCETFFNGNSVGSTTATITVRFAQGGPAADACGGLGQGCGIQRRDRGGGDQRIRPGLQQGRSEL